VSILGYIHYYNYYYYNYNALQPFVHFACEMNHWGSDRHNWFLESSQLHLMQSSIPPKGMQLALVSEILQGFWNTSSYGYTIFA